jgi:oligopeptide/dipeptide ABC transporter ATP-binding protein
MNEIQREDHMAIILITHDLGVVARMADRVAVMYAGEIVESGSVDDIFYRAAHPYTEGLQLAMPDAHNHDRLQAIPGSPPDLFSPPSGCGYHARCPHAMQVCARQSAQRYDIGQGHSASCWLQHPDAPQRQEADSNAG